MSVKRRGLCALTSVHDGRDLELSPQQTKRTPIISVVLWLLILLANIDVRTAIAAGSTSWDSVSSSSISVIASNPIRNRRSTDATVAINLNNVSGQTLAGPFRLVVTGLTPADKVSIGNATGNTDAGEPYFDLTGYVGTSFSVGGTGVVNAIVKGGGPNIFSLSTRLERQVAQVQPLTIKITSPATLLTIGHTPQTVKGSVSDAAAQVTLNGAPVTNSNGTFQADVALEEGHNTVSARAVNAKGEDVTDTISLSLDMTPPYLTAESPKDGDTVRTDKIAVSGLINDIVRGTVAEGQANVKVNGVTATVSNRSYLAENIALTEGDNTIKVDASDNVGNTASLTIRVKYQPLAPQHIELVSGQDQTAKINAVLNQPLKTKLLDANKQPVADKPVVFRVVQGDGLVGVGTQDQGQGTLVKTDAQGVATTSFKLGSRAGNGNQRVRATSVGFDGEVLFYASANIGTGNKVTVNAGNNQRGAIGQPLPQPFVVAVIDEGANVVPGAQIDFKVTQGSGKFQNGQTAISSTTDSDGRATAEFTLGSEEGLDVHRVTATLVGTDLSAGFTASALKTGPAGQTSINGVVLDNQDHPLPNVTLRVDGTTREGQTNAQGQFKITEVPVGSVRLIADGSTTTAVGEWPTLAFNLVTVAGAENPLPAPIYLVKLDTDNATQVGDQDVTLTLPQVPGFALEVKAGSVTFPDGNKTGKLSVTPVNASKIPMPPPNGMQPQFIVTIQPVGAKFDPPARLSLPNVDGHAPGAQVEMYSYDHDLEEFVSIGLGTVSAEGSIIKSNSGVGVIKAGWHCGSQPGGSGCCSGGGGGGNCGVCKKAKSNNCSDGSCENDDSQDPGECKKCSGGAPVNDDSEDPGECKSCKNGKAENDPAGSTCDDKKFCTSADGKNVGADQCDNGKCVGKKIDRKKTSEQVLEVDAGKYLAMFGDDPFKALKKGFACQVEGLNKTTIKGQRKEIKTEECCETQQKILDGTAVEENITVELPKLKCDWPFIALTPIGNVNLIAKGSISGQGKGFYTEYASTCQDPDQCNKQGGVQGSVIGTLGAELSYIHPNLISAEGQGRAPGSFTYSQKCDDPWQGKFCAGPVELRGTVKALSFVSYTWTYVVKDSFACTSGDTTTNP
jgi:hypothetical protein